MKKFLSMLLVAVMALSTMVMMTGCGGGSEDVADSEYVAEQGKLVVGITDFAPMDYKDDDGNWIGFDADMAKAFAESLGVECEFVEIDWDQKELELENKSIDVVWNGMTLTDAVMEAMETSNAYCDNGQVVVVSADKADKYQDAEACKELVFAVEAGSAGAQVAADNEFQVTEVQTQANALMEVKAGTADACIIDLLMADAMIGEGTSYPDLATAAKLSSEQYGVGFRKGSDLAEKLNAFFVDAYADGSMQTCADQYKIGASLIEQK
ncbi:MAG: transporter substrate-binding domain-containing protein [Anaerovoracaceae bacterium]